MPPLRRLLLITFIESFACILVERGIYFFCTYRLSCTDTENLWLAVAFGVAYAAGAVVSHPLCRRWPERRVLAVAILGQVLMNLLLAVAPIKAVVFVATAMIGAFNGAKWPIIESYVSAGRTPSETGRAVGRFNVSWAAAVPAALVIVGPLIHQRPGDTSLVAQLLGVSLFVTAAVINGLSLLLIRPLTSRPVHLPIDHPDRPAPAAMDRLRRMLTFSRWMMFFSYSSLFAMAALMPSIFRNLGCSEIIASPLSGVVDLMRLGAFVVLQRTARWHYRWLPLAIGMPAILVGFVLVTSGLGIGPVLAGEVLFGLAAGTIYYAALYYAMVVQNASVDAGGAHEGLIGLGFAVGPLACLLGTTLSPHLGSQTGGLMAGIAPLFLLCAGNAIIRARPPGTRSPTGRG